MCKVFWDFAIAREPAGLGLGSHLRAKESFFLVNSQLSDEERKRIALGIYALHMVICHCRGEPAQNIGFGKLLRLFALRSGRAGPAALDDVA